MQTYLCSSGKQKFNHHFISINLIPLSRLQNSISSYCLNTISNRWRIWRGGGRKSDQKHWEVHPCQPSSLGPLGNNFGGFCSRRFHHSCYLYSRIPCLPSIENSHPLAAGACQWYRLRLQGVREAKVRAVLAEEDNGPNCSDCWIDPGHQVLHRWPILHIARPVLSTYWLETCP